MWYFVKKSEGSGGLVRPNSDLGATFRWVYRHLSAGKKGYLGVKIGPF